VAGGYEWLERKTPVMRRQISDIISETKFNGCASTGAGRACGASQGGCWVLASITHDRSNRSGAGNRWCTAGVDGWRWLCRIIIRAHACLASHDIQVADAMPCTKCSPVAC